MITLFDPDRLRVGLAAFAGAVVYGVFTLVTLTMTGSHVSRLDLMRAALNVLAAAMCGVITAVTITPAVAAIIPWSAARDLPTIGFFIGALCWEVMPFFLAGVRNRARRESEKQGDV